MKDFIFDKNNTRSEVLAFLGNLTPELGYIYDSFFGFISRALLKCDLMSNKYGAFYAYEDKVKIIIEIFINIPYRRMPKSFFAMLAYNLNSVFPYVGKNLGQSFDADDYWQKNKKRIPKDIIDALKGFSSAGNNNYLALKKALISLESDEDDDELFS